MSRNTDSIIWLAIWYSLHLRRPTLRGPSRKATIGLVFWADQIFFGLRYYRRHIPYHIKYVHILYKKKKDIITQWHVILHTRIYELISFLYSLALKYQYLFFVLISCTNMDVVSRLYIMILAFYFIFCVRYNLGLMI